MSDKTYAETQGEAPFDWHYALEHPLEFWPSELSEKAANWVTCACGNQCAIIPRRPNTEDLPDGSPVDMKLKGLGHEFYELVDEQDYEQAKLVLDAIEARSAILIRKELDKLNT